MYDGYAFEVIVERHGHYPKDHDYPLVPQEAVLGDCWHRFYVRMLEVMQSIDLVRQAIDRYSTASGSYGEPVKLSSARRGSSVKSRAPSRLHGKIENAPGGSSAGKAPGSPPTAGMRIRALPTR